MGDKVVKYKPFVNWGPASAIIVTILTFLLGQIIGYFLFLFFYSLGSTIVGSFRYGFGNELENFRIIFKTLLELSDTLRFKPWFVFLQVLTISATTFLLLRGFIRYRKSSIRVLGFEKPFKRKYISQALVGFGVYFVSYIILAIVIDKLGVGVDFDQEQQLPFSKALQGFSLVFVFLSLVILPPLLEEILTRGFLYGGLRTKLNFWPAATITSVIFGAAHLQGGSGRPLLWAAAVDTFILSIILVRLREKSGSLWPAIILHAIKNFLAFVLLYIVKIG